MAMLSKKYNLPQNMNMNNADDIIQYLLNTGQITQAEYNRIRQMARMFN